MQARTSFWGEEEQFFVQASHDAVQAMARLLNADESWIERQFVEILRSFQRDAKPLTDDRAIVVESELTPVADQLDDGAERAAILRHAIAHSFQSGLNLILTRQFRPTLKISPLIKRCRKDAICCRFRTLDLRHVTLHFLGILH
jgi:hypothetical protein